MQGTILSLRQKEAVAVVQIINLLVRAVRSPPQQQVSAISTDLSTKEFSVAVASLTEFALTILHPLRSRSCLYTKK